MSDWEPPGPPPAPPAFGPPPMSYGPPLGPYGAPPAWGQPYGAAPATSLPWYRSTVFLVLGGLGMLLAGGVIGAVLGVIGVTASETFDESFGGGTATTYGPAGDLAQFTLRPGECAAAELFDATSYPEGSALSCEAQHGVELYATATAPTVHGDEGDDTVLDLAGFGDEACYAAFTPFVGLDYAESDYDYAAVVPSEQAWRQGARTVHCVVFAFDGGTTRGTARRSNR